MRKLTDGPNATLVRAWGEWMALSGAAHATVDCRTRTLRRLDREWGLDTLTRDELASWLAGFDRASTRSTALSYVRCFYQWAVDEEHVPADPTARLPKVRVPRATPRPVPGDELARMLAAARPRERLWAELMAWAGLRSCEVAACRPAHAWRTASGNWWLRIPRGKGGHDQQVPLRAWLGEKLTSAEPWDLTVLTVRRGVSGALRAVGSTATGHMLRYWYLTTALEQTGNLRIVQELARHASPATTARYTLVANDALSATAEAMPRVGG